ncbi:ATPase [Cereibacter sphaeroides]|uniref:ATPase n=1 Tax=Cereibacter sphaeroides TaxID=1063 RepID=UPI001F456725|nr:ATPase [Cereibacter sphaeroides]MCE6952934.1 ATPase [Cereibacter sphaeroides]MCE6961968.1 ATPase [Cereibacter sphaeroides]MCE6970743.1 ATPase [Cereibacter sphaeroides]MCE6975661.1 ATPase [Cereibacter sphaeroides]
MIYGSGAEWREATAKRVLLFGMSGLGKTHVSNLLRDSGDWFHYSVDYRIGTRYMGEHIADNFKREAMKVPFLRELLRTDSVYIASNITFNNLAPLSTYLGKPGNPEKGGLRFADYLERQAQHREAEVAALHDTQRFVRRASEIYGYQNFVCDSGGSICEVVDPDNPDDPVMSDLAGNLLMVWIKGSDAHTDELIRRFDKAPKPMYYQPGFLHSAWAEYRALKGVTEAEVDPDDFVRWTYARALAHRQPRYAAMARWGVTVTAEEVAAVRSAAEFVELIARTLDSRAAAA